MPFGEYAKSNLFQDLLASSFQKPATQEQVEHYAKQQVELRNIDRRKGGLPDLEFIRVEGDLIIMRDPIPMRYLVDQQSLDDDPCGS